MQSGDRDMEPFDPRSTETGDADHRYQGDDQSLQRNGAKDAATYMRTMLQKFSEAFDVQVRPLLEPIRSTTSALADASESLAVRDVLPVLRDLNHQVQVLIDKVAEQQAYVLIFGPLKSGKSTFMNAICSAYVSEVTALPAYPCIVNVTHSDQPQFIITRYDGQTITVDDRDQLHEKVDTAHRDLTEAIRRVEGEGEAFDPAVHMPEAIRSIDVKLPADGLETGAVLVDTPGLYSRMKFGYDRMTRDFRDVAACAIFVVKTDNLFLEQVFDEFNELLELFSRVFLIVNLDATKKDLRPDGQLVPSLEHENPQRIIDAFRNLSMSAPLKEAADQGRLNIYPVDLLRSASRRMQAAGGEMVRDADATDPPHGQAHFDQLVGDLTDYLNSNEYLREFMADSLRRARSLLRELQELPEIDTVRNLADQVQALRRQSQQAVRRSQAVSRLRQQDWSALTGTLHQPLRSGAGAQASQIGDAIGQSLGEAIDGWFDDDRSLAQLNEQQIEPLLAQARTRMIEFLQGELDRQVQTPHAGLKVPPQTRADLAEAEVDLHGLAIQALQRAAHDGAGQPVVSEITVDRVPVRRRLRDWLLLRSAGKVRRGLLGRPATADRAIAPEVKAKRLGDKARQAMQDTAGSQLAQLLAEAADALPQRFLADYVEKLLASLDSALDSLAGELKRTTADIQARLTEAEGVLERITNLADQADQASGELHKVGQRFVGDESQPPAETDAESESETESLYISEVDDPSAETADAREATSGADDDDTVHL